MSLNIVNSFKLTPPPPEIVGGWVELARTTLGSPSDTITVSGIANKRYYMFLIDGIAQNNISYHYRMGSGSIDTAGNYASKGSTDSGADGTATNATEINARGIDGPGNGFDVGYIANLSDKEKLLTAHNQQGGTAGAGTAPNRGEAVGKWAETSNPLDNFGIIEIDTGDMATGAQIVVLGWDPADTHADNFWEELASVDLSGGTADNLNSGTFTAKKYLWVQAFMEADGGLITGASTFNGDTAGNYARRRQSNGAADNTAGNETAIDVRGGENKNRFDNMFIINNFVNEKLVIGNLVVNPPASGAGVVPDRVEYVAKWANTSSQITSINYANTDAGSYGTASILKVWGSD